MRRYGPNATPRPDTLLQLRSFCTNLSYDSSRWNEKDDLR
jgi:hypothetical protein